MSDETPRLKLAQLVSLQELNTVTWNEALAQLDTLVDLCLLGQFVNTPPASPADGDAYLLGGAPTGAWSGYAYKIAACLDGAWRFYTPFNGMRAFVTTNSVVILYLNGAWAAIGSTDFATKSGTETLTNKTLGTTILPGSGSLVGAHGIVLNNTGAAPAVPASVQTGFRLIGNASNTRVVSIEGYGTSSGNFACAFARGTPDSPSAVLSNDQLYFSGMLGHNGSALIAAAAIRGFAYDNFTASAQGSYITLDITPGGTTSRRVGFKLDHDGTWLPGIDNTQAIGSASLRMATIYAGTGTINTSGAVTKTNIRAFTEAEAAVAVMLASHVRAFQFCDAVEKKGADTARIHIGMIYEDVVAAFVAHGLDPLRYGIICRDPALKVVTVAEDDGGATAVLEPDRDESGAQKWVLGLRYSELAQFVMAGLTSRLAVLEARGL